MNISSAVVHARPGAVAVVEAGLAELPGVEIHGVSPEGKLIVTIETEDDGSNAATYERIAQLDGVMSTAMVYHQTESEPEVEMAVEPVFQAKPQQ
ncbi:MAG: chaperone NapD [Betaproteobacteria bacterium]|jgi:periplasmic nitrate reductase NapD|nr:chaperone NapD [Rhodocyclales bacterium]